MPLPGAAGRHRTVVTTPVCRPVPESSTGAARVRLDIVSGPIVNERFQLIDNRDEPVQGGLRPQEFAVRTGRKPADVGPRSIRRRHPILVQPVALSMAKSTPAEI